MPKKFDPGLAVLAFVENDSSTNSAKKLLRYRVSKLTKTQRNKAAAIIVSRRDYSMNGIDYALLRAKQIQV